MDKNSANYWHIDAAFSMLLFHSVENDDAVLDANDEAQMKTAYREFVVPWVQGLSFESQEILRRSFAYFLSRGSLPAARMLARTQEISITEADDPLAVFVWLWQTLYPGLSPNQVETSMMVEDNDVMKTNDLQGIRLD